MSTDHDQLLAWFSTCGSTTEEAVSRACRSLADGSHQRIHSPRWDLLNPLHRLGHVERDSRRRGWRTVAPTLLWRGDVEGVGELYGARDEHLATELRRQLGPPFERIASEAGPETWRVSGSRTTVRSIAESTNLRWTIDETRRFLASLPSARRALGSLPLEDQTTATLARHRWERFEPGTSRPYWRSLGTETAAGLLRSREEQGPDQYLFIEEEALRGPASLNSPVASIRVRRIPDVEHRRLARWRVVADSRSSSLAWNRATRQLDLPSLLGAPLPLLLDRALILRSGRLPELRDRDGLSFSVYGEISLPAAQSVARILDLPLRVS